MSRPITAYEANLDNKDRREEWMEKRWPELCKEMAIAAAVQINGEDNDTVSQIIEDTLIDHDPLAEECYEAETREDEQ